MSQEIADQNLRATFQELARMGETYRSLYFGTALGPDQITQARELVDEMRRLTGVLKNQWAAFRESHHSAGDPWTAVKSPEPKPEEIRELMRNQMAISAVGGEALVDLDQAVVYALHYGRQSTYLEEHENSDVIREDAIELQAWIEQAARQVRDDVASAQSQIHLVSLYSQAMLTGRINLLTGTLVLLTRAAIVVSIIGAVAAGLAAGWAIASP